MCVYPPPLSIDQVLRFYGYYKEGVVESNIENHRVRKVILYYYLEDGSMHAAEPKQDNSGMPQVCEDLVIHCDCNQTSLQPAGSTRTLTFMHSLSHTYTHIHTHTHMHANKRTHAHTHIYTHTHTHTNTHTHTHTHTSTRTHTYTHTCTRTHIHTHSHTHTHAYIHTQTDAHMPHAFLTQIILVFVIQINAKQPWVSRLLSNAKQDMLSA